MKLYATPLSHFSRKVRILLDLYGLEYEFIDVGNVAEGGSEKFGGNPLARIPVLETGNDWLIDSDHIAEFAVRKFDPKDKFGVLERTPQILNARAVLNGIMLEEVTQILAKRTGVPVDQYAFFTKSRDSISRGLAWLEDNAALFETAEPRYLNFHLVCAWEHLDYYNLVPLHYHRLAILVHEAGSRAELQKSAPSVVKPRD